MSARHSLVVHWALPFIGAILILLLLAAPIGLGPTALARAIQDAMHAPLFALVAMGVLLWLRRLSRPASTLAQFLLALLLAVALGAVGEIVQSFTGTRQAQWVDLANDLLGALAGLSLYALCDKRQLLSASVRGTLYLVVLVAFALVTSPIAKVGFAHWQRWHQLPALVTWDSSAGHRFVKPGSARLRIVTLPREAGVHAVPALHVSPLRESRWVGVSIAEPWPDWRGYSHVAIELVNPNEAPLELILRINDRVHNNRFDDRFNRRFVVAPLERTVLQVPLTEVQAGPKSRQLDMERVALIVLFQDAQRAAHPWYLLGVRLVR